MVDAVWVEVRRQLRAGLSAKDFDTWIEPLRAVAWADGQLTVEAPSAFAVEWLRAHHLQVLEAAVASATGGAGCLKLTENRALASHEPPVRRSVLPIRDRRDAPRPPARGTFETFVVGDSNRVAYGAACAIVDQPGVRFNPLFVWGGVGLGKTHLLSAIAHARAERAGDRAGLYVTAETFVNEMIAALQRHQMDRFRDRFRRIPTLIVDDVQFLANKQRSQEEFTHTMNALRDAHGQIVLASDRAPHDMPGIEETLRSRFASGLLADVQPPDPALRLALVRRKVADAGLTLDEAVVEYLAGHWCHNGRTLEGVLTRIEAFAALAHRPITLELVREALTPYGRRVERRNLHRIVSEVCRHYRLTPDEIASPRRTARVVLPRQLAMYLCRRHTDESLVAIGAELGGRDRTTVLHALGAIEQRLQKDAKLRATISQLEARLTG